MARTLNLYWKSIDKTRSLIEEPFPSEEKLEEYIFNNQEILGDIYVIHRQIRTGTKEGIPDMLGVDQDSRICIIELKNLQADEDILPQALSYAIWAETNPDSIKAIWLESKNKPEDIEVDWDNLDIRLILIAPIFKSTVLRMAGKMGYPIDLMQVRRFISQEEEFLLVEVLEEQTLPKNRTTKVLGEWDWDFYEKEHGKKSTSQFRKIVLSIDEIVNRKGWNISYNLNKYYTGFKLGNRVVFNVSWGGTYAWKVKMKVPEVVAERTQLEDWELQRYDQNYSEAVFRPVDSEDPDVNQLEPLFIEAYNFVAGTD